MLRHSRIVKYFCKAPVPIRLQTTNIPAAPKLMPGELE